MMRNFYQLLFLLLLVSLCSCWRSASVTPTQELEASMATTSWLIERLGTVNNRQAAALIARVTKRLSEASLANSEVSEYLETYAANAPWQVYLLNSDEPNAFSVGAGVIIITRGLLARIKTEAEFAAILAHEMSHQILRHTNEAIYHAGVHDAPNFSFSLDQELEADALSLKILKVGRYQLDGAQKALSIAYRPLERVVSGRNTNWLQKRAAAIYQGIHRLGRIPKATSNSREFVRVRQQMQIYPAKRLSMSGQPLLP